MIELLQYWFLTGLLLAAAGWCVETLLSERGREARWVWVTTGLLTLASPILTSVWRAADSTSTVPGATGLTLPGVELLGAISAPAGGGVDVTLIVAVAWVLVSLAALASGAVALRRLHMSARGWRPGRVLGHDVLRSDDFGPAVIGVRRPRIVIPEDLPDCSDAELEMMLQHEVEHIRARDPLLLRLAYVAGALTPWNLALLWQVGRLRQSVEQDCDLRVIRQGAAPKPYGSLLLKMATRRALGPQWMAAAALAEDRSGVARRLRLLRDRSGQARTTMTALLIIAGATALGVWLGIPSPFHLGREGAHDGPAVWVPKAEVDVDVDPVIAPRVQVSVPDVEVVAPEVDVRVRPRIRVEQPPAGSVIRLRRGNAEPSATGETVDPLVYVDGIRFEGDVQSISPDDVERVEVLKGAAAAAMYGEEAAGGVIQIYLKEGVKRPGG